MNATHEIDRIGARGRPVVQLGREHALSLIARGGLGRAVYVRDCLPVAVPVDFVAVGGGVVFQSGAGTKLDSATRGDVMTVEADGFDPSSGRLWSVMVTGQARVLEPGEGLAREAAQALCPSVALVDPRWVWVPGTVVEGRALVLSSVPGPTAEH